VHHQQTRSVGLFSIEVRAGGGEEYRDILGPGRARLPPQRDERGSVRCRRVGCVCSSMDRTIIGPFRRRLQRCMAHVPSHFSVRSSMVACRAVKRRPGRLEDFEARCTSSEERPSAMVLGKSCPSFECAVYCTNNPFDEDERNIYPGLVTTKGR
jgi:hypothetical protein